MLALLFLTLQAGPHYRVESTWRNDEYIKTVADAVEPAYAHFSKMLGFEPREERFTLNLYATKEEYVAKDKELNDGRFANNGGFSHPKTGESYMQVQPRLEVPLLDRMETLVIHEAFHLATYRHATWVSRAPAWVYEGMAERAAELCVGRATLNISHKISLVRLMHERRRWIPLEDLLAGDDSSNADFLSRWLWYAEAWLLVRYLSEQRPDDWRKFLGRLRDSSQRGASHVRTLLLEATGPGLEDAWVEWFRTLKPAPWIFLDGDWRLTEDGLEGASRLGSSHWVLCTEPAKADRYSLTAEAKVEKIGAGQVDLLFSAAHDPRSNNLFKVSLVREGVASVVVRKDGAWNRVAFRPIDPASVPWDRWIKLEARVDGRKISFFADGRLVVEHAMADPDVDMSHVRWGVGGYDSFTRFRGIRFQAR